MRYAATVLLVLLLGACEGSFFSVGDRWHTPRITEAYVARDACMAKKAPAEKAANGDVTQAARALAQDCGPEIQKLVEITNRDGDSKVAANIRENSEFRAIGYVMRAPNQPASESVAEESGSRTH